MSGIKNIKIQTTGSNLSRVEKREAERLRKLPDSSPALLILYLIGIIGIMIAANTVFKITEVYFGIAEIAVILFSTLLWYIYIHHNKYFNRIVITICGAAFLFILLDMNTVSASIRDIYSGGSYQLPTYLIIILAYMLVLLVFTLEFVSRNHSIMFLLCSGILIFGPTVGISFTPVSVIMITVFQFGFLVFNMSVPSQRKSLIIKKGARINFISTLIVAGAFLVCFLPAFIIENIYEDDMLSQVHYVDGIIQDIVSNFSKNDENGVLDGAINRGNLRQTGEIMFTADIVDAPANRLYLKAFVGDRYDGDSWENAFERFIQQDPVYNAESTTLLYASDYTPERDDLNISYLKPNSSKSNSTYFREPFINSIINEEIKGFFSDFEKVLNEHGIYEKIESVSVDNAENPQQMEVYGTNLLYIKINYFQKSVQYSINLEDDKSLDINIDELPNYPTQILSDSSDPVNAVYSDSITTDLSESKKGNRICIAPYEKKFLNILIPYYSAKSVNEIQTGAENVSFTYSTAFGDTDTAKELYSDNEWRGSKTYENFIDSYINKIQNEYTYVPYENMPSLTNLCSETELSELNDITTFILYTLQTHADYSTTPGTVPYNKDTIEYFLFENHKGYCVHFATAAAMMYRMYGIPARYVTGYVIDPDSFSPIDDPESTSNDYEYRTEVTDRSAHAWVEIFLKDYGWVPVEVTPTADGDMIAQYPGYDHNEMERIMKRYGWRFGNTTDTTSHTGNTDVSEGLSLTQIVLIALSGLVLAVIIFTVIRWRFFLNKQSSMGCRRVFDRLIRALHYSGFLTELNGSEADFSEAFCEAVPIIDENDSVRLIQILQEDNFSECAANNEDTEFVRKIYDKAVKYLYEQLKWYKKPIFRFIKCLY